MQRQRIVTLFARFYSFFFYGFFRPLAERVDSRA